MAVNSHHKERPAVKCKAIKTPIQTIVISTHCRICIFSCLIRRGVIFSRSRVNNIPHIIITLHLGRGIYLFSIIHIAPDSTNYTPPRRYRLPPKILLASCGNYHRCRLCCSPEIFDNRTYNDIRKRRNQPI